MGRNLMVGLGAVAVSLLVGYLIAGWGGSGWALALLLMFTVWSMGERKHCADRGNRDRAVASPRFVWDSEMLSGLNPEIDGQRIPQDCYRLEAYSNGTGRAYCGDKVIEGKLVWQPPDLVSAE